MSPSVLTACFDGVPRRPEYGVACRVVRRWDMGRAADAVWAKMAGGGEGYHLSRT